MTVLILSSANDVHGQAVERHLQSLGEDVVYWRPKHLLTESTLTWELAEGGLAGSLVSTQADKQWQLDLASISSIWLRRPGRTKAKSMPERWLERLAENESNKALDSIFRLLPCLWVNDPIKHQEALLKIRQLSIARGCGFTIPKTLVTNNPEKVAEFYERHSGKIIYKLIDSESGLCFPIYETPRSVPAMSFRKEDLAFIEQVRFCLHLFQERVAKVSDLRVTVVGKKIFAAEIKSQAMGERLDWRLNQDLPMEPYKLSRKLEEQCLLLMRQLGLTFAAIDFCKTADDDLVFLEANPHGQFLWIEQALDLPISLELAKLLAGHAKPLTAT